MDGSAPSPSSTFGQNFRDLGALRRARDHRAIAGVAEGLSRHFDVDPIIVRVALVALAFFGGAGIILYVALWLTVPQEGSHDSLISRRLHRDPAAWLTVGLGVGGVLAAAALLGSMSWAVPHPFSLLLVLLVLAIGYRAVTRRSDRRYEAQSPAVGAVGAAAPPSAPTAETQVVATGWWQRPPSAPATPAPPIPLPPPPPRAPRSHLFGLTMAVVALALAGVWIVEGATSYDVPPSVYPGVALGIIAVALLVGTWAGRSRGLIVVGLLAALVTAAATVAGPGPYGQEVRRPHTAAELESSYDLGVGRLDVHLEDVTDPASLAGRHVHIDARVGRVTLYLPSTVAASVEATVDHGAIEGPADVTELDEGGHSVLMSPLSAGRPAMTITVHLRFGALFVERVACPGAPAPVSGESRTLWKGDSDAAAACH